MKLEILSKKSQLKKTKGSLLFVHGASHGAWCWEKYLQYFSKNGFDCYALSLRGHGKSAGFENLNSYGLNDYVNDILATIKKLSIKPILIGHSIGGVLTQKIIKNHPDKIKAAVILSPVPLKKMGLFWVVKLLLRDFIGGKTAISIFLGKKVTMKQLKNASFINNRISDKDLTRYAPLFKAESKKALKEMLEPRSSKRQKPKLPVCLIGSKADKLFPCSDQTELGKAYDKQTILLTNVCHDIMLDIEWEKGAREILKFIRRENL